MKKVKSIVNNDESCMRRWICSSLEPPDFKSHPWIQQGCDLESGLWRFETRFVLRFFLPIY